MPNPYRFDLNFISLTRFFFADATASTVSHLPLVAEPVARLLRRYDKLFQPSTHLPPSCKVNNRITLLPSTAPVNVRPYHYPHFQKSEIEKQVSKMLSAGLVRTSTSPYSSPVLLVKKKDDTWRMCVDY